MIEKLPVKAVNKVWGTEVWMANTEKYCGKLLCINAGYQCSYHHHKVKDEVFYCASSSVFVEVDGETSDLVEGEAIRIRPKTKHLFRAYDDAVLIEVSTHHDDEDSYRDSDRLSGPFASYVSLSNDRQCCGCQFCKYDTEKDIQRCEHFHLPNNLPLSGIVDPWGFCEFWRPRDDNE